MNIIDSLVVALSLDSTAFKQGSKDVDKSLKDTKENADRAAKEMEAKGKVAAQFFGQIRNQVIALAAVFTAGAGLKSFVESVTTADAAVGRTARNIGMTTEALTAWQGVAERAGGSAAGIAGSMQGLSQQFQQLALTGQSAVVPYFRAIGVALIDAQGKMRPMSDILLDLSDKFSKMDPQRAQALGRGMGLDEGTVNVLLHHRQELEALLEAQHKIGHANDADSAAAAKREYAYKALSQASTDLGRKLLTALTPAISVVIRGLTAMAEWFAKHPAVFTAFAATLGIVATAVTAALTMMSVKGFLGLAAAMFKIPPAAAAASASMELAAAKSGAGLLTMLGALAKGTALVAAAGAVGYAIGTAIYTAIEETPLADHIGRWIAKGLALFGNEDAKAALAAEDQSKAGQRTASGKVGPATASTAPRTTEQQRVQAEADVQKFMGMGWTRAQATGIAANLQRESGGNEKAVGDNGQAYGLAQWHKDRQLAFEKWAGKNIREASRDEQLAFVNFELREGSERRAGMNLMRARDAGSAASVVSRMYERPADTEGEASKRAGLAVSLLQPGPKLDPALQTGAAAAVASNTTNTTTSSQSHTETTIGQVNVTLPNATDAQSVAQGLGPALKKNFSLTAQANYGLS